MAFGSGRLYCGLVPVGRGVQAQERGVSVSNPLIIAEHTRGRIAALSSRFVFIDLHCFAKRFAATTSPLGGQKDRL
jgi:hypothetical protein